MLRHRIGFLDLNAVDRSVEKRDVIPRYKAPAVVEYRRDADTAELVRVVRGNRLVEVAAAVGAGKSTRIPKVLAQNLGKLVIHTIPFHIAAHRLADYVMSREDGDGVVFVDDLESDLPPHGVAVMSNAHLSERVFEKGVDDLQGAILYLDEVHESDCATAFFREMSPAMGFSCVVKATATSGPATQLRPFLPGSRIERTYPPTAVGTWTASDAQRPWAASEISGNTLICVDRANVRTRLAVEYRDQGFEVRVLTSRSTYAEYLEAERLLLNQNAGIVILLVDYAFRSSLTIPGLERIIDSCEVAVPHAEHGAPVYNYRKAYDFEVQQLLGRGARLPGEKVELFRSSEPSQRYMCDLEALEADAANVLFRMYGLRPPVKLAGFAFYEGKVPIDLPASFASDHPMRLCPDESLVPWVTGNLPRRREKVRDPFKYEARSRSRPKPVSCHTVLDTPRPVSPPPPMPPAYAVTELDVRDLPVSRASSRSGKVYTVASDDEEDPLSSYFDDDYVRRARPKRVSRRVARERSQSAGSVGEGESSGGNDSAMPAKVRDVVTALPVRLAGVAGEYKGLHDKLSTSEPRALLVALSDDELGTYVHYHGMDEPYDSAYFMRGLESVISFVERDGGTAARGLPKRERIYAMKKLVDALNNSTAVAMAIQRLFKEVSKRDAETFQDLVCQDKLLETLQWMSTECASSQAKVRLYRDLMPHFMDYRLTRLPPATELEQRVMIRMMQRFDEAAVKKDPDKLAHYMRGLNSRRVQMSRQESSSGSSRRKLEYI